MYTPLSFRIFPYIFAFIKINTFNNMIYRHYILGSLSSDHWVVVGDGARVI